MLFVANSPTVASQTNSVSPVYMASTSQTASSSWQAKTTWLRLQKALHAPARKKKVTILFTWGIKLFKPVSHMSNVKLVLQCRSQGHISDIEQAGTTQR